MQDREGFDWFEEFVRRAAARRSSTKIREIIEQSFPEQRAFILDKAKKKAAHPGRRAGKSSAIVRALYIEALQHPKTYALYIALTRQQAKDNLWGIVKEVNEAHELGGKVNETELSVRLPNGAVVKLGGADKPKECEKYRGLPICIAGVDEGASFGAYLQYLMEDVLEPATMDVDGQLFMIGTPAGHCMGYFHEATTAKASKWSTHHWTVLDNIFIPHAERWLSEKMEEKGWSEDSPKYLLEYLGQWVQDASGLVYKFKRTLNTYSGPLEASANESRVLGIDLGYDDDTAFTVGTFGEYDRRLWIPESYKRPEMRITEIANEIQQLIDKWGGFNKIVVDTGGLGKSIVAEMGPRLSLPLFAAEKSNKKEFIELINDDFQAGRILLSTDGAEPLIEEVCMLPWDEDRRQEDSRFANHCSDAMLYMWREAKHWLSRTRTSKPEAGTAEYYKQLEAEIEQQAIADAQGPENWWNK